MNAKVPAQITLRDSLSHAHFSLGEAERIATEIEYLMTGENVMRRAEEDHQSTGVQMPGICESAHDLGGRIQLLSEMLMTIRGMVAPQPVATAINQVTR